MAFRLPPSVQPESLTAAVQRVVNREEQLIDRHDEVVVRIERTTGVAGSIAEGDSDASDEIVHGHYSVIVAVTGARERQRPELLSSLIPIAGEE